MARSLSNPQVAHHDSTLWSRFLDHFPHHQSKHPCRSPGYQIVQGSPKGVEHVTTTTSKGVVKGFRRKAGGAATFRGVPYAASTAGENRWKPPQPAAPWTGEKDCTDYGQAVMQNEVSMKLGPTPAGGDIGKRGDDCLNVNIVTPSTSGKAPVMVWIHGGSNLMGSNKGDSVGASPTWDDSWADRGVVACALNYRFALHGFMHMPEFGVTNLALRDLIGGLRWIQEEIANFGGDPNNVTIFGQSAGGINCTSLLCSPLAKGLFNKVIIQSGGVSMIGVEQYNEICYPDYKKCVAPKLAKGAKEWTLENLSKLSCDDVFQATKKYYNSLMNGEGVAKSPPDYHSLLDGDVLPLDPLKYLAEGGAAGVTVMVGSGNHEAAMLKAFMGSFIAGRLIYPMLGPMGTRGQAGFLKSDEAKFPKKAVDKFCTAFKKEVATLVDGDGPKSHGADEGDGGARMVSFLFGCGGAACVKLCAALLEAKVDVYAYNIKMLPRESPKWGNGHCIDLPLLFKPADELEANHVAKCFFNIPYYDAAVAKVSDDIRASWVAFATTGAPGSFAGVEWPAFPQAMTIASSPKVVLSEFSAQAPIVKAWYRLLDEHGIKSSASAELI